MKLEQKVFVKNQFNYLMKRLILFYLNHPNGLLYQMKIYFKNFKYKNNNY